VLSCVQALAVHTPGLQAGSPTQQNAECMTAPNSLACHVHVCAARVAEGGATGIVISLSLALGRALVSRVPPHKGPALALLPAEFCNQRLC
jgi:hypothetical protein